MKPHLGTTAIEDGRRPKALWSRDSILPTIQSRREQNSENKIDHTPENFSRSLALRENHRITGVEL